MSRVTGVAPVMWGGWPTSTSRRSSSWSARPGGALAHLPTVWVVAGITLALVGLAPRAASPVAWAVVAAVVVIALFARSLDWPGRVSDLSPLSWTPTATVETWAVGPAAVLLAVAATLLAAGFTGFRQRDLLTS